MLALPLSLYPSPSTPSPLCGQNLTLTAPSTGKSLTARVVGASDRDSYTAMSQAAFQALGGDLQGGEVGIVMEFVDSSVAIPSSAAGAVQSGAGKVVAAASSSANSPAAVAQTTTTQAAKTSSPAQTTTQAPTTQAKQTTSATTTTSSWDSASAASASAASKSSADAAWACASCLPSSFLVFFLALERTDKMRVRAFDHSELVRCRCCRCRLQE